MGWPREELDAPSLVWEQGGEGLVQEATLRATRPLSATLSLGNALGDIVSGTFSGQTWTWRAWTPWRSRALFVSCFLLCLLATRDLGASTSTSPGGRSII